jgi:plasmid stabilization system protein ParE
MEYEVKTSESADRDLDEILAHIAGKLANPRAERRLSPLRR